MKHVYVSHDAEGAIRATGPYDTAEQAREAAHFDFDVTGERFAIVALRSHNVQKMMLLTAD